MKPRFNPSCCPASTWLALLLSSGGIAGASTLYWDGTTAGWDVPANWSTIPGATSPDPVSAPTTGDTAVFNVTTVNGVETVAMNADQAADGLVFNNTGTTALQGGGTNRALTLGAGGISMAAGAGAVTIGTPTASQNVAITLGSSQAWSNASTVNTLIIGNGITGAASTVVNLTVSGVGNSQIGDNTVSNTTVGIANGAGGTVSLTKNGTGTLTLLVGNAAGNPFSYTGDTTVNGGTLNINNGSKNFNSSLNGSRIIMGGGTFTSSTTANRGLTFNGLAVNAGASTVTAGAFTTLDFGGTAGNQGITRTVGGTINFTIGGGGGTKGFKSAQANTNGIVGGYATFGNDWLSSAGTGITSGALTAYAGYTSDAWAASNNTTVTTSGAIAADSTTYSLRFAAAAANSLTLSGTNTLTSGGLLVSSAVGANATNVSGGSLQGAAGGGLIVHQNNANAAGALTIGSTIVDNTSATALTKSGTGTLILSGGNGYTGATYVNAGTLQIGNGTSGSITSGSAITVRAGATLGINQANGSTLSNTISGEGSLNRAGSGVNTLSGNNSYSGITSINSGTLKIGSVTALGTSALGGNFAGTLDVNGFAITNAVVDKAINGGTITNTGAAVDLTGMGNIGATAARTVTLDGTGNMTFGQAITGQYGIIKNGLNTTTLAGTNNYSGATAVNAGKFNVTGSLAAGSAVTVQNSGSILSGTGVVAGTVNIASAGAVLAAGNLGDNAPGKLITGALTLSSGAVFSWDLTASLDGDSSDGDTGLRGTNYDAIDSPAVTVNNAIFRIILGDTPLADIQAGSVFWGQTQVWNDVFNTSFASGFSSVEVLNDEFQDAIPTIDDYGSFAISGSTLTWTAIPEPTTALTGLLLATGFLAGGLLRHRRA